jgi:predicted MFS family arabinose efflux permease
MARPTFPYFLNNLAAQQSYSKKPAGFKWRSSKWFIVSSVSIALWTDFFLYGLIVPILPFLLEDRLKLSKHQIQSYVSGLLAAFAGSSLIFSPVIAYGADQISTRQWPFLLGLLALFGSTTLLLLGRTILVLFIARILQGLSGAFVWTVGLVLCVETVGTEKLGQTMGSVCYGYQNNLLVTDKVADIQFHRCR